MPSSSALRRLAAPFALTLLCACGGAGPASDQRPDLILLVVDTLRADHMSLYGYERETTPSIADWATGGTVFEQAKSGSSWTVPSMHMMLTGRYLAADKARLTPDRRPLAAILSDAGYTTGAFVSNALLNPTQGYSIGFDDYDVIPRPKSLEESNGWTADEMVAMGLEWWNAQEDGPKFLLLHLYDPHPPYIPKIPLAFEEPTREERQAQFRFMMETVAEEYRDKVNAETVGTVLRSIRLYDTEILQMDQGLAGLFAELERTGDDENTLVVLTSDHGEGLWRRQPTLGDPLAMTMPFPALYMGHGTQLYSEQVHVPLALRGPGVTGGVRRGEMVSTLDIVPTILGRLGVEAPEGLSGLDLFTDAADAVDRPIFSMCSRFTSVTVDERWRLHVPAPYRVEKFGAVPELYDLESDPEERTPIDDPQRIAELTAMIEQWRVENTPDESAFVTGEERARQEALLEALGYTDQLDGADGKQ